MWREEVDPRRENKELEAAEEWEAHEDEMFIRLINLGVGFCIVSYSAEVSLADVHHNTSLHQIL